ncbi:MAG TPA: MarR family winged helix-turn-helix transcriptional regulator [Mycobacterium sp.]|nr:MarR family winged helix-turn-helix transcriptional regulator [Mycobacterium sp.]
MAPISAEDQAHGLGYLLRQLGNHATTLFADQIAAIDLTLLHVGILRAVAADPGRSQQALSAQLGLVPSRLVAHMDELEERGYIERRRNRSDRRLHALHLTGEGRKLIRKLSGLTRDHEDRLTAGLDPKQREALHELLTTMVAHQGLAPHGGGYRVQEIWVTKPTATGIATTKLGTVTP